MSSAEFYYQIRRNRFFRLLFYFLELQSRGIRTDTWEGKIPFDVVPEKVQAIVYNDTTYHDYLLRRIKAEHLRIVDDKGKVVEENLPPRFEEDLIMSFLKFNHKSLDTGISMSI